MAVPTALRFVEPQALGYRRTWRASVFSNFLNPVLYLLAMGASLGTLVDAAADPSGAGLPYLVWLGPGLLAAQAMQTAVGEGAFPVMAGFRWRKTYLLVTQTPLAAEDIAISTIVWQTIRVLQVCGIYAVVLIFFDVVDVPGAISLTLVAGLIGIAFGPATMAFTSSLKNELGLTNLFRYGVVPMFLFSGTFFPISQLPDWLAPVAYVVPLFHGVELARAVSIDLPTTLPWWVSVGYLLIWAAIGTALTLRAFHRKLVV